MRILVVANSDNIGGVEKRYSNLYKYFASSKTIESQVSFLINKKLWKKIESYHIEPKSKNVNVYVFGSDLIRNSLFLKVFVRLLEFVDVLFWSFVNNRYDIVIYTTATSLRLRYLIRSKLSVVSVYGYTLRSNKKIVYKYGSLTQKGYLLDCLSDNIAKEIKKNERVQESKVFVTPFSFGDYEDTECEFEEKQNVISFVSRLDKIKGVSLLLDSIKKTIAQEDNVLFYIIGYGELKSVIDKFIHDNKYYDKVKCFFSSNPKEELKKSKIFLSLQDEENYPSQSLLEAMACKNAIIATNVGLTYKLVDENCGYLINKDPNIIKDKIVDLINNYEVNKKMGENARLKIINNYTAENYYNYILELRTYAT